MPNWWLGSLKKENECKRIMGIPEAYAIGIKKQDRKTLHARISVWIKDFNKLQMIHYTMIIGTQN